MTNPITNRDDILRELTKRLRRKSMDDLSYARLLTMYAKLQGWIR